MKMIIEITMNSAAFEEELRSMETSRILKRLAERIEYSQMQEGDGEYLFDINGNRVGHWIIDDEKENENETNPDSKKS